MKIIVPVDNMAYCAREEEFDIVVNDDNLFGVANILLNTERLHMNDKARDYVVNRILNTYLSGLNFTYIKYILFTGYNLYSINFIKEYHLFLDFDDLMKKFPEKIKKSFFSKDIKIEALQPFEVLAGDVKVYTKFDSDLNDHLDADSFKELLLKSEVFKNLVKE